MIDLKTEDCILLSRAGPVVPGRPSVPTLFRWALKGCRGIKLETIMVGGRRFTSTQAIQRFVNRLSQDNTQGDGPESESQKKRQARVDELLDRFGM
jgi:hypothetical protein